MSFDQFRIQRLRDRSGFGSTATVLLPILGIVVSEGLLYFGYTWYALWGHLVTLLGTSVLPLRFESETPTYQALILVPVFRLVNLGMPVFFDLTIYWLPLVYGPFVPGLYLVKRSQNLTTRSRNHSTALLILPGSLLFVLLLFADGQLDIDVGPSAIVNVLWFLAVYSTLSLGIYLRKPSNDQSQLSVRLKRILPLVPSALVLAVFLAEIEFRILHPVSLISQWNAVDLLVVGIVMFGFVGFVEELLFRGIVQPALESRFGVVPGLLLSSGLFTVMHSGFGLPQELLFGFVIGLLLGVIYDWTDSIGLVTLIHGTLNLLLFAVLPMHGSLLPV